MLAGTFQLEEKDRERQTKRDTERLNSSHSDPRPTCHTLVTLEQSLAGHFLIQKVSQVFWSEFHGLPNFPSAYPEFPNSSQGGTLDSGPL